MTFLFRNQFNLGFVSEHKLDFLNNRGTSNREDADFKSVLNRDTRWECKIEIFLKKDFNRIFFSDNEDYIPLNSVFKLPVVENLTELCVQLDCPGNCFNIDKGVKSV